MGYKFANKSELQNAISAWNGFYATDWVRENFPASYYGDPNTWDVSAINDFSNLFYSGISGRETFNYDISNWDVSNGTDFSYMFGEAAAFNQDISKWDVSNGTDFSNMFYNATSFNQDIGDWDVSNGVTFQSMFFNAEAFNQDIGNWDVSNGTNFSSMFRYTEVFNQDIGGWDVSGGTNWAFGYMFADTKAFNQDIGDWDVSNVSDFRSVFSRAEAFNGDIRSWDVSNGANFRSMFYGAKSFNQDLTYWNASYEFKVPWVPFGGMFQDADLMLANGWQGGYSGNENHPFLGQTKTGDSTAETITGSGGNDVLWGLAGDDTISGGDGWDKISGGSGDDLLYGGTKDDTINGGLGNDDIYGGDGKDTAVFSKIDNTVNLGKTSIQDTGEGWDYLDSIENVNAGAGNDSITGNSSNNIIKGEAGTDTFIFSSNRKDYKVTYLSSYLKIEDLRSGSPDGTDNLYSIEKLQFSERTYSTSNLFFNPDNHSIENNYTLVNIRDYDGNLHANSGSVSDELKSSYKYQGKLDINNDGVLDAIYTNKVSGRWVAGKIDSVTGQIDYSDHGQGGGTRVVGIYDDPLIAVGNSNGGFLNDGVTPAPAQFGATGSDRYLVVNGETIDRLALNSQVRFQNDLLNDNLTVKTSGDYDSDGFQEVYWKTNDGNVYLRSLMHSDGNIQYANYQNQTQMSDYLTGHGYQSVISDII